MKQTATQGAVEAVWRIEAAKLIGALARIVGDVALAEDLAQDALVDALRRWPQSGVPDNPGAWLMAAAKYRAIDSLRRAKTAERKHEQIARSLAFDRARLETPLQIEDDVLRLMFACAHPALAVETRVALTLRLVGGLTTPEIARGLLISEAAAAQRIVRAKRALSSAEVAFEIPAADEVGPRLRCVRDVVYLVFNEGYAASSGAEWTRPALCEDALRLGRVLAGLVPGDREVHGLVALMELQASRIAARTSDSGLPILLADQDRSRWDRLLIQRGLAALARAMAGGPPGPFALQAAIAACHACAPSARATDWERIVALYDELVAVAPSPVIELNRAVAVAVLSGPASGLALVDALATEPALASYHLLPSVRAELLAALGRDEEARAELDRAISLAGNERERELLAARRAAADVR